ncbi:MAG: hypothetical protein NT116_05970 [Candidatus Parcubacteria bacterium]|nr:hypothetical protein [Candidatus Parcubacteria bacterium]
MIKILQLAKEKPLEYFVTLSLDINDLKAINMVTENLVLVNMERPLKSLEFLESI